MCMSCGAKKPNTSAMMNSYTPKKALSSAKSSSKGSSKGSFTGWGAGFGGSPNFGQPKVTFSGRGKK